MKAINRILINVNPKDEHVVNGLHTTHHWYGAENHGTVRHGTVHSVPNSVTWLKKGDYVWFNHRANKQKGDDEHGNIPCVLLEDNGKEIWALSIPWAERTVMGVGDEGEVSSTPNYVAAIPIKKKVNSSLIDVEVGSQEEEIRAECIEDKEGLKVGDTLHFQNGADYPARGNNSNWIKYDGKRVIFIKKEKIFGNERNGKFKNFGDWNIVKTLDEGSKYETNSLGILIERTDIREVQGDGEITYSSSEYIKVGDKIKRPVRGYWELYIQGEKRYAINNEYIWWRYNDEG